MDTDSPLTGLLIDGAWTRPAGRGTFAVEDPATLEVVAEVCDARPEDGVAALDAAVASAQRWRETTPRDRADLLRAVYDEVVGRTDEFAALITAECGKPLDEARGEVAYGADFVRWFAEEAVRLPGLARPAPAGGTQLVHSRPVGPALLVTPWNFPLAMATRKIAPALAAGCTVVVKPASPTPLTTALFADVVLRHLTERGLPTGVLNVVPTSSASDLSAAVMGDRRLRKLSFTGSTAVGQQLLRTAADGVLRTSMELGGNAPFLVLDDADLDAAVSGALVAKMRNAGQTCVAANRFYVQAGVADEFTDRLTAAFAALEVGDGRHGAQVGPLIDACAVDHMHEVVAAGRAGGARVMTGGDAPRDGAGHFFSPTVLAGVAPDADLLGTEIFGPVAPVVTFGSDDEGLALANATDEGLVAYAWTRDLDRATRLTQQLDAGMIGLNRGLVSDATAPFGGTKMSGLGREGGHAGLAEYLETVYVAC